MSGERLRPGSGAYGLFTVDVEDWYHPLIKDPRQWAALEDRIWPATLALLEPLESAGHRGTFFVLGCVAARHPDLVRRILAGGHEVGCHGHDHLSLQRIDPVRFRADLVRALDALRAAGAREIVSFRAPYFSLNRTTTWALPILAEHGIRIDSSVFPLRTGYYGHAGAANHPERMGPVFEFPITLPSFAGVRIPLTGGFYSRFFPAGWTVAGLEQVRRGGGEPMFYIHPWELDPGQPRGVAPVPWTVNICGVSWPRRTGLSGLPAPDLRLMPTRDRGSAGLLRSRFPVPQPESPLRASFRS